MADIIPFNNEDEQEIHQCETCDLVNEFVEYAKVTETREDLFNVLSELVFEAKRLALKEHLLEELNYKAALLDELEYGCCEEE